MPRRIVKAVDIIKPHLPERKLRIVDVGHGSNIQPLKIMNELLPQKKELIAVDIDNNAEIITRERFPEFSKKITFREDDARDLKFEDSSVDVLLNNNLWFSTLIHPSQLAFSEKRGLEWVFHDLEDHLKEAHRVLNKDGHLVVAGYYAPERLNTEENVRAFLDKYNFDIVHLDKDLLIAKPRKG